MCARMAVRGMTAEQLFDSLVEATGFGERSPGKASSGPEAVAAARTQFLAKFASQEKRTEFHTSILQALALINGQIIADVTSADVLTSKRLAAVILYPGFDTPERINRLYLITLTRRPRPDKPPQLINYV